MSRQEFIDAARRHGIPECFASVMWENLRADLKALPVEKISVDWITEVSREMLEIPTVD